MFLVVVREVLMVMHDDYRFVILGGEEKIGGMNNNIYNLYFNIQNICIINGIMILLHII